VREPSASLSYGLGKVRKYAPPAQTKIISRPDNCHIPPLEMAVFLYFQNRGALEVTLCSSVAALKSKEDIGL
jgi:hypothetical protein